MPIVRKALCLVVLCLKMRSVWKTVVLQCIFFALCQGLSGFLHVVKTREFAPNLVMEIVDKAETSLDSPRMQKASDSMTRGEASSTLLTSERGRPYEACLSNGRAELIDQSIFPKGLWS